MPPSPIPEILAVPPVPALSLDPRRERIALLAREDLTTLRELAEPELGLAGVRINPRTSGPSRATWYRGLAFMAVAPGSPRAEVELPPEPRISSPRWSPDGRRLAFLLTRGDSIELWSAEAETAHAERLLDGVSDVLGSAFEWLPDGSGLLVKRVPRDRGEPPSRPEVPVAPVIQESGGGVAAPARTYRHLLSDRHDEALFEYHSAAELVRVSLGGDVSAFAPAAIYSDVSISPDGAHVLTERIVPPYSYLVPWSRFAAEVEVRNDSGRVVRAVASLPLAETVPIAFDAVPDAPRNFHWRADAPATLVWARPLDGGDPGRDVPIRDELLCWPAPFRGAPEPLARLEQRFAGVVWGDGNTALLYSRWWDTRRMRVVRLRPDRPAADATVLFDRSMEDRYGDPGAPIVTRSERGQSVLLLSPDGGSIYLAGDGASPRGSYPFLDRLEVETGATERLWQAEDPYYESVAAVLDPEARRLITRRESRQEPPNFHLHDRTAGTIAPLTDFPDPAPQLAGIGRELITYARADGVELSATLYTPPGYDPVRDGALPTLVWAYPREYLDANAAGQLDDSPNRFSRPAGASPLFLLTQGMAVLEGPAMPVVARDGGEPNDTYIDQLVLGAEAAVRAVVDRGVADRARIFIGGHSYGAAMAANLLAHTDLFAAGIARSGAYNRTLTPFGFQYEQRTYWEAPEVYARMSPFAHADRIHRPLLLIHGAADDNSGTFPLQSERLFHALRGHGAPARYVSLPLESHGYRARESVLHVLAEMVEWCGAAARE